MRYDTLEDVRLLFNSPRPVKYVASFDVADGYHHFQIASAFWRYFGFHVDKEFFWAKTLPFGWNQSPHYFVHLFNIFVRWLKAPM